MRTRIIFSLENRGALLPFHYQFIVDELIRKVIATGDSQEYIDYRQYSFSSLKGKVKVGRGGVHFCSYKVTLVFSTPSKPFMDYFIRRLFDQERVKIGNLKLIPEETVEEVAVSFEDSMRFLCISPIILRLKSLDDPLRFISPEEDEFSDLLYESTMMRMADSGQYTEDELSSFYQFQLVADQEYLFRMEEESKKYSRICSLYDADDKTEARIYTFPFTMYAPRQVQEFIYENGVGHLCHKGFGLLDLAEAKTNSPVRYQRSNVWKEKPSLYM